MRELINIDNAEYILSLTKGEIKDVVFDSDVYDESGGKYSWNTYYNNICKYLRGVIARKGESVVGYKYANGKSSGRRYSTTFAIQSLQCKLRGFLINSDYKDYDMKNCHPTLLLYYCNKNNLHVPLLGEYVLNREKTISENMISKTDVLIAINKDSNSNKNMWIKLFSSQLRDAKNELLKIYPRNSNNSKNPISSRINLLLCELENEILTKVENTLLDCDTYSLMFDGIMTTKSLEIDDLNKLTEEEYGISWSQKEHDTSIILPSNYVPSHVLKEQYQKEYISLRNVFEKTNVMIKAPLTYLSFVNNNWNHYTRTSFAYLHESTVKLPIGDNKFKKFIEMWFEDPDKSCYENIDFVPYNLNRVQTEGTFNTFEPFKYADNNVPDNIEFIDDYIYPLIFNLCERNHILASYLINHISQLLKYPESPTGVICCFKGGQGSGKDTLISLIEKMMGHKRYSFRSDKPDLIFGGFNSSIENKIIIQIDEQSNKNAIEYLENVKHLVTAETIAIHHKGKEAYDVKNIARLFICSNNNKPVIISNDDRRFFIVESSNNLNQKKEFFEPLYSGLNDDTIIASVYNWFMKRDIENVDFKKIPDSEYKKIMKETNVKPIIRHFYELTCNDWNYHKNKKGEHIITNTDFAKSVINYMKYNGFSTEGYSTYKIRLELEEFKNYITFNKQFKIEDVKHRGLIITDMVGLHENMKSTYFSNDNEEAEEIMIID